MDKAKLEDSRWIIANKVSQIATDCYNKQPQNYYDAMEKGSSSDLDVNLYHVNGAKATGASQVGTPKQSIFDRRLSIYKLPWRIDEWKGSS